ncbi:malic enzyme-like NAD(P)-binding protein [Candidatus Cytomitobacter primus]|uniref:NADP-dependent malic enzyme n=1 Tax=Candidatus Cytomitobacter primus TaxID=2066024 RepID=A0A5C0UH09_9PROT|nr:malic enzyme-like NAD(P)-binding protein [Candidatus Cytomitobacter primus]QEK38582.1 hypothetical protein FZC34_01505 [Candidatus Cytomitobacter primus]
MDQIKKSLKYHSNFPKGKWGMHATKPLTLQDMALAYSPGVADPCLEIERDLETAKEYTAKQNLVAVISNGTAVLGLGNIGALASKPVMEGKCILMNKMSGVFGVDIEVDEKDSDKIIEIIRKISPTFGAINLEDIKAPECFIIEEALQDLDIPVFHDDQHGTAIVATAGIENALKLSGKSWGSVKVVANGAGAAGIACLDSMVNMGLNPNNIMLFDSKGLINDTRSDLNKYKQKYAINKKSCTLEEALNGADIFLGMSAAKALKPEWIVNMAKDPVIFGLANPEPEIMPELAKEVRPDCIMATGRSDYPNQVNNILCFPYIFRGALDSQAKSINNEMKKACIKAIAEIARNDKSFGTSHIIPNSLDERLGLIVSNAVAQAAIESGAGKSVPNLYGRYIEKMLNINSERYFNIYNGSNPINIDNIQTDIQSFLNAWETPIKSDSNSQYVIKPMEKSCNGEKLVWIFGLESSNPWIAYSTSENSIIKDIRSILSLSNMPHIPVVDIKQCRDLEKRNDFCGRISLNEGLKMEFKPGLRNIAYLTLLLSGIANVKITY